MASNAVATVARTLVGVSLATLKLDIGGIIALLKGLIDEHQNTMREIAELGRAVALIEVALPKVPQIGTDDFLVLTTVRSLLQAGTSVLNEVARQRKKVFGTFRKNSYQVQLATIRRELFEVVPILTLAYVSGAAAEQKGLTASSPTSTSSRTMSDDKKAFDATVFFDHPDTRVFWSQHVGATVRKIGWDDFAEAVQYTLGKQPDDMMAALRRECGQGADCAFVSCYSLAKFCGRSSLRAAALKVGQMTRQAQIKPMIDMLMSMVTKALSGENAYDEVAALRKLCDGKRSAEEARSVALTYINLLREMNSLLNETWGSLRAQITLALQQAAANARDLNLQETSLKYFVDYLLATDFLTDNTSLPTSTRDFMSKALHGALTEGVAAYNRGNIQQCADSYAKAAAAIVTPSQTHSCDSLCMFDECMGTLHPLLDVLSRALAVSRQAEFATNYMFQAWLLRRAFDFYYVNKIL